MGLRLHSLLLRSTALLAGMLAPRPAAAGIPECNDLRLEDAASCQLKGSVDCEAGCNDIGIYKKACATRLHNVCRDVCTLDPEPTCTDACTEQCSADCDAGVNVICIHNCFDECEGVCTEQCADAENPDTCRASCEATCDGECDVQCRPLVEGSCYQHCIECCGGSCGAQANMTCQTECQDEEFESCEYDLRLDCEASCDVDGALFCDGEFVMSGPETETCLNALLARGITEAERVVNDELDDVTIASSDGCSVLNRPTSSTLSLWLVALLGLRTRRVWRHA